MVTPFTRLVGCAHPLQQAGMGAVATVELAAAVANAGALGMLGGALVPAPALAAALDTLASRARGAFGVNFLMPFLDLDAVDAAARRARVVEFFYDAPDATLVRRAKAGGALVAWQVGSVDEAVAAEAAGCDLVVAQGVEAGGHVRGTIGLLPLLEQVLARVRVPVVAGGGIASARGVAGVLAAGAAAARVGTRFVAAAECDAHPAYQQALVDARPEDTVYTEAFSVLWPNAPHRVLRSAIAAAERAPETVGEVALAGAKQPIARFSVLPPTRDTVGRIEAMALYAGESVAAVHAIQPAAEIVRELVDGASALLAAKDKEKA